MKKGVLLFIFILINVVSVWGQAFRKQRYDSFKVMPINNESIVFIGNSITNMHDWFEAFNNPNIVNRGVSAAVSTEVLDNLESILVGQPKKIFLMIGTNDLNKNASTPAQVAERVRSIILRCKKESPSTELYVQSILPSNNNRTPANQKIANDSICKLCDELGATYIDLWDDLQGILNGSISLDRLHLKASGYRIWCNKIAKYVGSESVYKDNYTDIFGGLAYSFGNYCSFYGMMPIKSDDVIFLGDCTVNTGEWHELLQSAKVKKRATSWDVPGVVIERIQPMLQAIFTGNNNKEEPRQVLVELGYQEAVNKMDVEQFVAKYKGFIDEVRQYCPNTRLTLLAIYPTNDANVNKNYIEKFNKRIKELADTTSNAEFVEGTYTELLKNGVADTDFYSGIYLQGRGYAKFARIISPYIPGTTPITDDEACSRIATFKARTTLGAAISTAEALPEGDEVGQYTTEVLDPIKSEITNGYALLAKDGIANSQYIAKGAELTESIQCILPNINFPQTSTTNDEHWYQLSTPNRNNRYMASTGAGKPLLGQEYSASRSTNWKFVERNDGTYDIINRADNSYISPTSNYNTAISTKATQPATGWKLSYSNTPMLFIISSGTVQLNQTNLNNAIYNWSKGKDGEDRNDAGCQFRLTEVHNRIIDFTQGKLSVSMQTGAFANPSANFNAVWRSTHIDPQITFSCTANNMAKKDTCITIAPGMKKNDTYTIDVGEGFEITDFSFVHATADGSATAIKISCEGLTTTTSGSEKMFEIKHLNKQRVSFKLSGENKSIVLKNFIVSVRNANSDITDMSPSISITKKTTQPAVYNMQGVRVSKMERGAYIVNSRKIVR